MTLFFFFFVAPSTPRNIFEREAIVLKQLNGAHCTHVPRLIFHGVDSILCRPIIITSPVVSKTAVQVSKPASKKLLKKVEDALVKVVSTLHSLGWLYFDWHANNLGFLQPADAEEEDSCQVVLLDFNSCQRLDSARDQLADHYNDDFSPPTSFFTRSDESFQTEHDLVGIMILLHYLATGSLPWQGQNAFVAMLEKESWITRPEQQAVLVRLRSSLFGRSSSPSTPSGSPGNKVSVGTEKVHQHPSRAVTSCFLAEE